MTVAFCVGVYISLKAKPFLDESCIDRFGVILHRLILRPLTLLKDKWLLLLRGHQPLAILAFAVVVMGDR